MQKKSSFVIYPVLLLVYEIIVYLSNDMYFPALPQITTDLNTSQEMTRLSLTAWFLGGALPNLIMGPLSDAYGRKTILLTSAMVFVVSSLVCGLSTDMTMLIMARFFQGSAVTAIAVGGWASIHELMEEKEAVKILAWMNAMTIIAPALGPLLGVLVLLFFSWSAIFILLALSAFVVSILLLKYLPESHPPESRVKLDFSASMSNYGKILTNRGFAVNMFALGMNFCGTLAWLSSSPFIVVVQLGYSPVVLGVVMLVVFFGFVVGSIIVGKALETKTLDTISKAGLSVSLVAGVASVLATFLIPPLLITLTAFMFVYSVGSGLLYSTLQKQAINACSESMGVIMALFSALLATSAALGSILVELTIFEDSLHALSVVLVVLACKFGYPAK